MEKEIYIFLSFIQFHEFVVMDSIIIAEIPSQIWNFSHYFQLPIDRSSITVAEHLQMNGILWNFGDVPEPDFRVYKEENIRNGLISVRRLKNEYQKRFENIPYMNLNGEAQENSRCSYLLANPERTFSVAPGKKFNRLYFPSLWSDPQLDTWEERSDSICWIGRPLPERIKIAKKISKMGIGLDIFSKDPWPIPNWKGFAPDEIATSRKYQYRVVCENSVQNLYHSEKLFNSIRSGCVTFYISDPNLHLPHLDGSFLPCQDEYLQNRSKYCNDILKKMSNVMFGEAWEIYSFREFFNKIINFARGGH